MWLGSETALIYHKRFRTDLNFLDVPSCDGEGSSTFFVPRLLQNYLFRRLVEGCIEEGHIILALLRDTAPEIHLGAHILLGCYCETPRSTLPEGYIPSGGELDIILSHVWHHFEHSLNDPMPLNIVMPVLQSIGTTNDDGRTLLHLIAASIHPHFGVGSLNIVTVIASFLVTRGYSPDVKDHSEKTPLDLAVEFGNHGVIDALLVNGVTSTTWRNALRRAANRHDCHMLKRLALENFSVAHSLFFQDCLFEAVCVPGPERKLWYGNEAQSRGLETVKILMEHAFEHENDLVGWAEQNFVSLIKFGNVDIFRFFLDKLKFVPSANINYVDLLKLSMTTQQRSMFDLLIKYCPNLDARDGEMSLLQVAAQMSWWDTYFFLILIGYGAEVTATEDGTMIAIVTEFIRNDGQGIFLLSNSYPQYFRERRLINQDCSIFDFAVQWGFPLTIKGFLQAGYDYVGFVEDKPLSRAAISSRPTCLETLEVLLLHEAKLKDPMRQFRLGTALICACEAGNAEAVKMLLNAQANPAFVFTKGGFCWSPLLAACLRCDKFRENGNSQMAIRSQFEREKFKAVRTMLISSGLDSNHRFGSSNMTAEEYAHCLYRYPLFQGCND